MKTFQSVTLWNKGQLALYFFVGILFSAGIAYIDPTHTYDYMVYFMLVYATVILFFGALFSFRPYHSRKIVATKDDSFVLYGWPYRGKQFSYSAITYIFVRYDAHKTPYQIKLVFESNGEKIFTISTVPKSPKIPFIGTTVVGLSQLIDIFLHQATHAQVETETQKKWVLPSQYKKVIETTSAEGETRTPTPQM